MATPVYLWRAALPDDLDAIASAGYLIFVIAPREVPGGNNIIGMTALTISTRFYAPILTAMGGEG
jgi:hypothetical protein